ncbi:uncharacterized protein K452DRAFT_358373 [Neofusicoccum parvum]|nr:uncharacterized protein K452DRAFT_358373 [Neofusicoccum parvum]
MEGACEYPPEATAWISPVVPNPECLKRFLRSGQYSDLVIRCGDRTWNVHKVVVCSQCEFLQNTCSKGFQEEKSGIIELNHDPADAVDAMLEWAYSGDYLLPKVDTGCWTGCS